MTLTRWRPVCAAMAMTAVLAGCSRLGVVFEKSAANADATITFTVIDADTGDEVAAGELTAAEPGAGYLLKGGESARNLQVEGTYDDGAGNTSSFSSEVFALGAGEVIYVLIDNPEEGPTVTLSDENTTGVVIGSWDCADQ